MKSKIIATGSYVPKTIVSNRDFQAIMDTNDEWIVQRTGIKTRRFESESNTHMAKEASLKALEMIDKETIDLIVVCTYTPDAFIPTSASMLKMALGIERSIPCFDLNAACTGFIYGLQVVNGLLLSRLYKRILLVGSDMTSRTLDFNDRSTAILFGDGAGAVVMELGDVGMIETNLYGQDDVDESIVLSNIISSANPFVDKEAEALSLFDMKGSDVFRFAIKAFTKSVKELIENHGLKGEDIDFVISHQANARIIETAARMLKMDIDKFPMNLEQYGNTSAASIPIVLDELNKADKLKPGMKIIFVAFGGGLTYGASLIEW